jgi:hypothetical protein
MRRLGITLSAIAIAAAPFAAASPAFADHGEPYGAEGTCGSDGEKALGVQTVTTPAGVFYVDDRNFLLGNGLWLYRESNKLPHLQRKAGEKATGPMSVEASSNDTCDDAAGSDPAAEGWAPDEHFF